MFTNHNPWQPEREALVLSKIHLRPFWDHLRPSVKLMFVKANQGEYFFTSRHRLYSLQNYFIVFYKKIVIALWAELRMSRAFKIKVQNNEGWFKFIGELRFIGHLIRLSQSFIHQIAFTVMWYSFIIATLLFSLLLSYCLEDRS